MNALFSFPPPAELPEIAGLPDVFRFAEGRRLTDAAAWPDLRREHLARILHYQYGDLPRSPDGTAVTATLVLTLPEGDGPFPALLTGDLCWGRRSPEIANEVTRRGYALAEFDRTAAGPDNAERGGVYSLLPDYDGGRIAAWAWGYHRIVDRLLQNPRIDARRIVVTGHSRGGKAALLAGATDERIALTAPNNSGCGGAGCYRHQAEGSEDIAAILKNFPYWFHPRFAEFVGRIVCLPFDQHTLKACVAPRLLLTTEAFGDLWANPEGSRVSHEAAKPLFDLLDVGENIAIHFRPGGHEHNLQDWIALLDFADARLR